ncbi:RNA polymerase sigma factor [Phenylobacterium sp.]|uniref:RNA polymerase sigma factor n=1 Tax=Phenylobacterium sp. TaxID=1871053 RepID=UPI0035AECB09
MSRTHLRSAESLRRRSSGAVCVASLSSSEPFPPDGTLRSGELSSAYRRPLMAFFLRHTDDRAEAEDLTQEVFVRILKGAPETSVQAPDAFVFTIAANLLRDRLRLRIAKRADRHVSLDVDPTQDGPSEPLNIAAETVSAERVLMDRQRLKAVLKALEELPPRTRDIFVLARLEKLKHAEIASRMGVSVSAVEKNLVRAVAHLARRFGP